VIDLRLYRFALLTVPVAVAIAMFSLQEVPSTLAPGIPPDAFDSSTANSLAKELAETAPNPTPGSDSDESLAELVKARFSEIDGVTVSEQRFDASFDGEDVELRNLIAVLPGTSEGQIALIAPRDVAQGSGALTSDASTAALLEIANSFSGSSHRKTLVFVSTDGSSIGALGARRFVRDYSDAGLLDAAIDLSQPAAPDPEPPLVIPWSSGAQSTAAQLAETANATVSEQVDVPAGDEGPLSDLFRLALPAGLGEQAPLIEAGVPAVRLSSDGELPMKSSDDEIESFSPDTFDRVGRAALALILALDSSNEPVEHGPEGYIGLAGNLLPGWTVALLALALLAPAGLAAGGGLAASARSPGEAVRGSLWAALRALPFLAAAIVVWLAARVGLMPSPDFPFDPNIEGLGAGGTVAVIAAVLSYGAVAFFLRPLRPPPTGAVAAANPAALAVAVVAALGIWAANPYLGLLVAIGLQAWVFAASRRAGGGQLVAAALVLLGLIPAVALVGDLAGRFQVGYSVWHDLLLMFADGQIAGSLVLLGCLWAGAGVAIVAAAGPGPTAPDPEMRLRRPGEPPPPPEPENDAEPDGEIAVRRRPSPPGPEDEPAPDPEEAPEAEPEGEPAQPEPERDPRLWSKPLGSSSRPPGRRRATPSPSFA
jgi:Peptidase family M28